MSCQCHHRGIVLCVNLTRRHHVKHSGCYDTGRRCVGRPCECWVDALKEVATATLTAAVEEEGEDGKLVDGGSAWKLMGALLQAVAHSSSQAHMSKQWKDTGLHLDAFFALVSDSTDWAGFGRGQNTTSVKFVMHKAQLPCLSAFSYLTG